MKKIVVTGGCGFIGSNLVRLLSRVKNEITVVDNLSKGSLLNIESVPNVHFVKADIRDSEAMQQVIEGQEVVIHLAAFGSVIESVTDPMENFSVNVEGMLRVLTVARSCGIKRFIFSSTGGALIGNANPPVNEESPPRPISPYGASKLAGEGYCCAFSHSYDMDIVALRFANVIGPISWHKKGAVTAFFKAILVGHPIVIFGNGTATRDFLYVEDLCRGIIAATQKPLVGFNVFHLASGKEIQIKKLAYLCREIAGSPKHPIHFEPKRTGEVERNFALYDLAKSALAFEPRHSIEEALKRTWKWFKKIAESKS